MWLYYFTPAKISDEMSLYCNRRFIDYVITKLATCISHVVGELITKHFWINFTFQVFELFYTGASSNENYFKIYNEFYLLFLAIKPTRCNNFPNLFLEGNSTCFGQFLCPSSGIFSLYTQQWYISYRFADSLRAGAYAPARKQSANLYDIYHCCVCSEKLLMMDRGTVRNMYSFLPKINLGN